MNKLLLSGTVPALVIHNEDFELGLRLGRQAYGEEYEGEMLTDSEVMEFIEESLCRERHEYGNRLGRALFNSPPISYSYAVGFVVGWLAALMAAPSAFSPVFSINGSLCATRYALDA